LKPVGRPSLAAGSVARISAALSGVTGKISNRAGASRSSRCARAT
jgi:hypothetical protein